MEHNSIIPDAVEIASKDKLLPVKSLKTGRSRSTKIKLNIREKSVKKIDSPKNWNMRFFLFAPITFRRLISLILTAERAVTRFIKFIQANTIKNIAMNEKI
jgi:hypothetical protein